MIARICICHLNHMILINVTGHMCSGAIAAMEVGFATIVSSYAMGGILLAFFVTSSLLTRVSSSMKRRIDAEFKEGGQRDWKQVGPPWLAVHPNMPFISYSHTWICMGSCHQAQRPVFLFVLLSGQACSKFWLSCEQSHNSSPFDTLAVHTLKHTIVFASNRTVPFVVGSLLCI